MIIYVTKHAKDMSYDHSRILDFGGVVIDYNACGEIIGVEVLNADEHIEKYDNFGNEIENGQLH